MCVVDARDHKRNKSSDSTAVITFMINQLCTSSTITPRKLQWQERGMVPVGVVAQWQSTGGLSQRPWVQLPAAPPFFRALCCFKGLWTATAQIVSFIRCNLYWSSDHRGVPSIELLHCCDNTYLSHQLCTQQLTVHLILMHHC